MALTRAKPVGKKKSRVGATRRHEATTTATKSATAKSATAPSARKKPTTATAKRTTKRPTAERTTTRPTAERTNAKRPTAERTTTKRSATTPPARKTPTTKRPTTKRPTIKRPTTKRPTTKRPTTKRPATKRPATGRATTPPARKKPTTAPTSTPARTRSTRRGPAPSDAPLVPSRKPHPRDSDPRRAPPPSPPPPPPSERVIAACSGLPTERALSDEERAAMSKVAITARTFLGVTGAPADIVERIGAYVDEVRRGLTTPPRNQDVRLGLGVLWGEQIRAQVGWLWVHLTYEDGFASYALVPDDRALACFPLNRIPDLLKPGATTTNTSVPLFEAIRTGDLPSVPPNAYLVIG